MNKVILKLFLVLLSLPVWGRHYSYQQLLEMAQKENIQKKMDKLELQKTQSKLKNAKSENYPEIYGVLGGESRKATSEKSTGVDTEKFIAEVRMDYNLYKFGATNKKIKALNEIKNNQSKSLNISEFIFERKFERSFFSALYYKKVSELLKSELERNKIIERLVRKRQKSGLIGNSDLLDVGMRESSLQSEILSNEASLDEAIELLRRFSLISREEELEIDGEFSVKKIDYTSQELIEKAKSFNKEYQMAKAQMQASQYEVKSLEASNLPEVNLKARFGKMRIDETYTTDNSLEGLAGVYIDIPIWDGGKRKSRIDLQKLRASKARLELQRVKRDLDVEVAHEFHKLQNSLKQIELAQKNVEASKRYYKNVLKEYERGIKNSIDLVSARDRFFSFRKSLIEFKMKFMMSLSNLQEVTGMNL